MFWFVFHFFCLLSFLFQLSKAMLTRVHDPALSSPAHLFVCLAPLAACCCLSTAQTHVARKPCTGRPCGGAEPCGEAQVGASLADPGLDK